VPSTNLVHGSSEDTACCCGGGLCWVLGRTTAAANTTSTAVLAANSALLARGESISSSPRLLVIRESCVAQRIGSDRYEAIDKARWVN
jgi:hypothetical protein